MPPPKKKNIWQFLGPLILMQFHSWFTYILLLLQLHGGTPAVQPRADTPAGAGTVLPKTIQRRQGLEVSHQAAKRMEATSLVVPMAADR